MTALIDGDSLFYIIGYNNREESADDYGSINNVNQGVDSFVDTILLLTQSNDYLGFIGCAEEGKKSFRSETYKYNIYKGDRPEEPFWLTMWKPVIRKRLEEKWGFISFPYLEADDLIAMLVHRMLPSSAEYIICSPDKDLKQLEGFHYDYKQTIPEDRKVVITTVSEEKANFNLWHQVIMGDHSDCVAGVPGLGEAKAKKLLEEANDPFEFGSIALRAYCKYFGPYYGPIIYRENVSAIRLMTPEHPNFRPFGEDFAQLGDLTPRNRPAGPESIFE
jgi:5'-3' exonuclease